MSEIRNNQKFLKLYQKRNKVTKKIKKDFPTIKAAEGTQWHRKHRKLQRWINSLQQKLSVKLFDKAVDHFWKTIYTEIVDKQLQGISQNEEFQN